VTALWNANAFFAYVFSVVLLGVPLDTRKLGAVLIATAGVLAVVYGGSQNSESSEDEATTEDSSHSAAPLLGNVLTLIASMTYGLYQVLYKKYAALSPDNSSTTTHNGFYQAVADHGDADEAERTYDRQSTLPFGLFPNFLTGSVGLATIIVLGIFIPILDLLGIEEFRAIPDVRTAASIAVIAISGMVFNSGYMVRNQVQPLLRAPN
jgi:drug/metabolite transporter (DMT)-like permease